MENLSLFAQPEDVNAITTNNLSYGHLDVVKMEFLEAETVGWEDLFSGFDTMHAITYSSGIGFVYQLRLLGLYGCQ